MGTSLRQVLMNQQSVENLPFPETTQHWLARQGVVDPNQLIYLQVEFDEATMPVAGWDNAVGPGRPSLQPSVNVLEPNLVSQDEVATTFGQISFAGVRYVYTPQQRLENEMRGMGIHGEELPPPPSATWLETWIAGDCLKLYGREDLAEEPHRTRLQRRLMDRHIMDYGPQPEIKQAARGPGYMLRGTMQQALIIDDEVRAYLACYQTQQWPDQSEQGAGGVDQPGPSGSVW